MKKIAKSRKASKSPAQRKTVKPVPDGYSSVTPYLAIGGASAAIDFYKKAFGARELMRMAAPDGKIGHAELRIGDSRVMLADEYDGMDFLGPRSRGGSAVTLHLYVKDSDATVARAVAAGARITRPLKDEFYGDRTGTIEDPFGHVWHIATHKEDLTKAQMRKRAEAAMKNPQG